MAHPGFESVPKRDCTGLPIPAWAQPDLDQGERNYEDSDNELGERRRGGDIRRVDPRQYRQRPRQNRRRARDDGSLTCPVCNMVFTKYNQLAFHYEAEHSICDLKLSTVQSFCCTKCMQTFRRVGTYESHTCPATKLLSRFNYIDNEERVDGPDKTLNDPLPSHFHIYTDGSGGSSGSMEAPQHAGWGAAVFDQENPTMEVP